ICINSVNNQILEIYVSNNIGYTVNVTKINVTGSSNGMSLSQNISSLLGAGQSGIFYVNGACNKSSSSYSGSATITYTEPGQIFSGPYFSKGTLSAVAASSNLEKVGSFNPTTSSKIVVTVASIPVGAQPRTVTAWFKVYSIANNGGGNIFYWGGGCQWFSTDVGQYQDQLEINQCGSNQAFSTAINTNTWYFVAFETTGTEQTGYIGSSGTLSAPLGEAFNANTLYSQFFIGDGADPPGYWNGSIADVQVYNVALSQAQIQRIYTAGIGGAPFSNGGLIGWWPLDGNANDYSGNNNNGVATNVNWVSP
ncbi:MAG: LamG domain-containing protein, partial [Candidatus Parvarchaeota archaeon]|nr:LamG domain-containing protein [Candidatus Parvarchaeota archaeon]